MWSEAWEWVGARRSSSYLRLQQLNGTHLAVFLGIALTAAILARFWKRGRRRAPKARVAEVSKAPPTGLEALVAKLDRRAAELGYPRRRSAAPLEHWRKVPVPDIERKAGLRILERFYRARFGGVAVSPGEAGELARELDAS